MAIVPFNAMHADEVAKLHIQEINTGFISSLGLPFVKALYKAIAEHESSFGFVEQDGDVIQGFLVFASNLNHLYKTMFLKKLPRLFFPLIGKLLFFKTLQNIYETLFYPRKTKILNLPEAELLSIAVAKSFQGRGIARQLVQEGLKECAKRNIKSVKVLVDIANEAANTLYLHNGFRLANQITSHGVLSNIYVTETDEREHNEKQFIPFKTSKQVTIRSYDNRYMHVLKKQDRRVFTIEGVDWFEYKYFITPAYLPHCYPAISTANVEKALIASGALFARWESEFGNIQQGQWWHVIRKGPWYSQECSSKTRSRIRRGRKRLHVEIVSPETIASKGYEVCKKASKRYKTPRFLPDVASFQKKVLSAQTYPENFQFFGVFTGNELIAFSENYIQENAVFWESTWYDPEHLRNYSSYVLIDAILNYYLNESKYSYVSDGTRSIYHKTNVQDFLIHNFGFIKEYAVLHVKYTPFFRYGLRASSFLFPLLHSINKFPLHIPFTAEVEGLLLQEKIRKSYSK